MAEFTGFTLFGIHSDKYKVYSVSDGSYYNIPLFAEFEDKTIAIDGMDGVFYVGTNIRSKRYELKLFIDGITESEFRQVQTWLSPRKIGKLIFDETPYKAYNVKIESAPIFSHVPYSIVNGSYIYRGEMTINLVAFDPYAYSIFTASNKNTLDNNTVGTYPYSGILDYKYLPNDALANIAVASKTFKVYNGGNSRSKTIIVVKNGVVAGTNVTIKNNKTNQQFTLTNLPANLQVTIDANKGQITSNLGNASNYHTGGFIEIEPTLPTEIVSNVVISNGQNKVTKVDYIFPADVVGRYISFGNNRSYKVITRNSDNQVTLESTIVEATGTYEMAIYDLNDFTITASGGVGFNIVEVSVKYPYTYL